MDPELLLDGLDPSQRRAVTTGESPLAILAGAGSGKTRVLTRRIAYRCATDAADARHVLAITFTRRAAEELDQRLRRMGLRDLPAAGTFHAIAYAQLRNHWAATGTSAPVLLDRKARLLGSILGRAGRFSTADLATEIEWAKARLVTPDRYPVAAAQADRRLPVDPDRVADWFRRYEVEKRKRHAVDFDDLLSHCADAIERDASFAAAQRWRFRHLFVDEYQDLNPLQEQLLRAWLGDRKDLAVVGDPNQAIYGWNGADPRFLTDFTSHHPGAEVVRLEHSYRSTPEIVATAAAVLAGGRPSAEPPLQAHRAHGSPPIVTGYATDADEAQGIARAVHDLHAPGRPWSAQAVLVRTNAQTALIEAAFRRSAIPYRVRGAGGVLDHAGVKMLLKQFDRASEPLSTSLTDLETTIAAREARSDEEYGSPTGPETDDRHSADRETAALAQILRLGRDLLTVEPHARAEDFSGWLRTTLREDGPNQGDGVSIVSFHAAKGLEWSAVHIAGVEAGLVPITHARTAEDRAEEQRLFYVALSRAADVVRCSWAKQRTFGANPVDRKPSPMLNWVRTTAAEVARHNSDTEDPSAALSQSRRKLSADPSTDAAARAHALRTALQQWRAEQARAGAVRPTVVLADKAVEALVRRQPADSAELAEVADIGPSVRERHGTRLLAIVAEHREPAPTPSVR